MQRPILSSDQRVLDYLRGHMAYDPIERLRVLFLNAGNELIADEVMGVGTVSSVHAWPREILKRCLDLEATAILLVHNHPSGCSKPSRADRDLTEKIAKAASSLGVIVHDHLVVARKGTTSFRMAGYL
jgi:DNA repair protein RadC